MIPKVFRGRVLPTTGLQILRPDGQGETRDTIGDKGHADPSMAPMRMRLSTPFFQNVVYLLRLDGRGRTNSAASTSIASAIWPRTIMRAETSVRSIAPM